MFKAKLKSLYTRFTTQKQFQRLAAVCVVIIVAGIGTYLLSSSHAASPYGSADADSGTLTGVANSQTCAGADDGNCVQFGTASTTGAPTSPPITVCGNATYLKSPYSYSSSATSLTAYTSGTTGLPTFGSSGSDFPNATKGYIIPTGAIDSTGINNNYDVVANTVYWFAPGSHTFSGQFDQIQPANGDVFIGGQGAVLDGSGTAQTAFAGSSTSTTIEYLTIQNFTAAVGQYVVNANADAGWTIEYDTIQGTTSGAALGSGSNNVIEYNCLTNNAEYGANLGGSNVTLSYNEVSYNSLNSQYFPNDIPCNGCSGGAKFWASTNATVENNYIHDNGGVGLWFDTNNAGALIKGNYISNSFQNALIYEISYNALITDNTFVNNGWSYSQSAAGNVVGEAIYINQSGGDPNVSSNYSGTFTVSNNTLTNNWDGIVVYQNSDRICSNNYTTDCTLDDPSIYTNTTCSSGSGGDNKATSPESSNTPGTSPYDYYDYCQWKPDNITVEGNTINFNPSTIIGASVPTQWQPYVTLSNCPTSGYLSTTSAPPTGNEYYCGFNGMYAYLGSGAPLGETWVVESALMSTTSHNLNTNGEAPDNNVWKDDTYTGPQSFQAYSQGSGNQNGYPVQLDFSNWQSNWNQDNGSTYN